MPGRVLVARLEIFNGSHRSEADGSKSWWLESKEFRIFLDPATHFFDTIKPFNIEVHVATFELET